MHWIPYKKGGGYMADNVSDFKELVRDIESKKILLPDFQRDFVWKDEEKQKKIVASVLTKMPIGSILLLTSKADEYCSKVIGKNEDLDTSDIKDSVDFLLDGQQRITVLTNVFSDVIHDNCPKVKELVSLSLKRRFFLRIPKWMDVYKGKEEDLFGVRHLAFSLQNPDVDIPDFLSGQILNFIETQTFNVNDSKPFNPHTTPTTNIDTFCVSYPEGYLVPLYMLIPFGKKKNAIMKRYIDIINAIAEGLYKEIYNYYLSLQSCDERQDFMKEILADDPDTFEEIMESSPTMEDPFEGVLEDRKDLWGAALKTYLESCIKNVYLSQIRVGESQRARAIDIYENLNMGGVSLNTFDLIMARVAKVSKKNFLMRLKEDMGKERSYPSSILSAEIKNAMGSILVNQDHNATIRTGCINKEEINSRYIDAFLDVLCLYCNNLSFDPDNYKVDFIKKDQILRLDPESIDDNTEKVVDALDRALFFFETRCGIRTISEINYNLMLVLVGCIFMKDENYYNSSVHDLLEAWYWSAVFSGEYDKDQNAHMIANLQNMTRRIKGANKDMAWLISMSENVLKMPNFSDKRLLLMDRTNEERYPKPVLRNFICQYLLSKTYTDMFDMKKCVSVFCKDAASLEAHHIIPLGSAKKVGEVAADLRKKNGHICNSPLNFVYITKDANKEISDDPIDVYEKRIQPAAKSALHITSYTANAINTEQKVHDILENRFDMLYGEITGEINNLMQNWR